MTSVSLDIRIWAVCLLFPEMLSLAITVFRLHHRWKSRLLWWDDYLALMAFLSALPFSWTTWALVVGEIYSPSTRVAIAWIATICFLLTLWMTKISLALSMARVVYMFPTNTVFRRLLVLALSLGLLGIASLVTRCVVCATYGSWRTQAPYVCPATPLGSILPYTAAIICDIALVLTPLRLFWNVQLPPVARRLILVGFAASCLMVPLDVAITVYAYAATGGPRPSYRALIIHLGSVISLVSCNAVVILTWIYRRRNREDTKFISELGDLSQVPITQLITMPTTSAFAWTTTTVSRSATWDNAQEVGSTALTEVSMHDSDFGTGIYTESRSDKTPSDAGKSFVAQQEELDPQVSAS